MQIKKSETTASIKSVDDVSNLWQQWTLHEITFLEEHYNSLPIKEIAAKLRRTPGAVKAKAHQLSVQCERTDIWSEVENSIVRNIYPGAGAKGTAEALSAAGFNRTERAVQVHAGRLRVNYREAFSYLESLPQPVFFQQLSHIYFSRTQKKLTYKILSELCFVSYSRVQKWFAPGSGQEPLSTQLKHHFWLACCSSN